MVVGGSMSGLLAGLLLQRAGWSVDIFERVESELAGRGAGIVAQPDLIDTLRRIGIGRPISGSRSRPGRCSIPPAGWPVSSNARRCSPRGSVSIGHCGMHLRRSATTGAERSGLRADP